jgi:hypothetical protein
LLSCVPQHDLKKDFMSKKFVFENITGRDTCF